MPCMTGRIVRGVGGLYTVRDEETEQEFVLRARGRLRRERKTPMVGDRVVYLPGSGEEHGWLEEILPRSSCCVRPPVANLDVLALVIAPVPQPDLLLVDRMIVFARRSGIQPLLCDNKCDMDGGALFAACEAAYARAETPVLALSAREGRGLDALRDRLADRTVCFAGQSAVGKSSLLNALLGLQLPTGDVSRKTERGRHTTRHAQLLYADGFRVMDTPGFSLLGFEDGFAPEELAQAYPDFEPYAPGCRFAPCLHDREPGCAVRAAADAGEISHERWTRYVTLLGELRDKWRNRYD